MIIVHDMSIDQTRDTCPLAGVCEGHAAFQPYLQSLGFAYAATVHAVSAFIPGILAKRAAGHSQPRLRTKVEVDISPA